MEYERQRWIETGSTRVGVIGVGGMGGTHAVNLAQNTRGANISAVMDAVSVRAQEIAGQCGEAHVFERAEDLIEDDIVDAIIVASPDATHCDLVLHCLAVGKPVPCEKPLATTARDAQGILEADHSLPHPLVQVGFMRRYDPWHVAVKSALVAGRVGEVKVFKGWHRNMRARKGVTSERIVLGSAIHDIDSARWMLGAEICEVFIAGLILTAAMFYPVFDQPSGDKNAYTT